MVPSVIGIALDCKNAGALVDGYASPAWPWEEGEQQQMTLVDHLEESVLHTIRCGTAKSDIQYCNTSAGLSDPAAIRRLI